ncbi:glycosyltransferase family 2 protein [Leptospira ilyithenensis]|uniref:Glycosyltransferase family 2 protein n=1 Tax=Leptospira ilyithenensis TaxID=2484901 RepID=A0A4R9LKI3_9LEPT|nr:glycosyltransferase family 2 protein [Leptospira ilyithenensis]TGN08042.1 glycosyltransferase family 2 protein [Leptospira ilyithenensis]
MQLLSYTKSIYHLYSRLGGKRFLFLVRSKVLKFFFEKKRTDINLFPETIGNAEYALWLRKYFPRESDCEGMKDVCKILSYKPLVSIITPVYNPPIPFFKAAIDSVLAQVYENWELCLADDASTDTEIKNIIETYRKKDSRIKVIYRNKNGHISDASNSALSIAKGEFVALLDQDDLLTKDALFQNILALNKNRSIDMIYSDEDKITEDGKLFSPFFKPDWSQESYLSRNYTCHFSLYRKKIIDRIKGFRKGLEGSQDYDLMLRFSEKTDRIYHIPKILYHWRTHINSTSLNAGAKSYAAVAGERALVEALERRKEKGIVEPVPGYAGNFNIRYSLKNNPKVSIVIPSRNQSAFLEKCLNSIFAKSSYQNIEVVLVDNGTDEKKAISLIHHWKEKEPDRFLWLEYDIPFNFSKLINYGCENASGEYLIILNNDTEIISPDWVESLLSQAQREKTGAVGCMLLYSDETIQHAGVILGVGGIANHSMLGEYCESTKHYCYLKLTNNVSAVTGACFMISKKKFKKVGGLDENFAVSYNDIDFCLKLGKLGYRNLYLPYVRIFHYESKSRGSDVSPEKKIRLERESKMMEEKWKEVIDKDPYYNPNLSRSKFDFSLNV